MIALPRHNNKIEYVFPFSVLGLSILGLANKIAFNGDNSINYLSIAISLIGITAFVLYTKDKKIYATLFQIWAVTQVIVFELYLPDHKTNQYIQQTIWNVAQVYNFSFYFSGVTHSNAKFEIGFNVLGLVYIGFARLVYLSSLFGTKISIKPFKKDSFLATYLPTTATVQQRVTLSNEKDWLLIKLDKTNPDNKIEYALIKPKEKGTFSPKEKNKIVFFMTVQDPSVIKDENKKSDFTTGDWAVVN